MSFFIAGFLKVLLEAFKKFDRTLAEVLEFVQILLAIRQ